ncbi:hypothetical protein CIB48_g10586 [Xylaria polymorpha]|nr:hypothetical protein CIB48_g10586 [Xylaria polymorpha]
MVSSALIDVWGNATSAGPQRLLDLQGFKQRLKDKVKPKLFEVRYFDLVKLVNQHPLSSQIASKLKPRKAGKYAKHATYRALAIKVDVTNAESVQEFVASTVKEFERIDYAVNSAGVSLSLHTARAVLEGGAQLSSSAPRTPVDALALQSAIRVNAVCPSWVDTPMVQLAIEKNPMLKHAIDHITPLKRAATVDEVADYIIFLSSPSASFINSTALPIDAGLTLPTPPPLPSS